MPLNYGLIETADIPLPELPDGLDGLRLIHLTDLHIRRESPRLTRLIEQLCSTRIDLVLLTGDYMDRGGPEEPAYEFLAELAKKARPHLGIFGTFGNHDSPSLYERCQDLPITWLDDRAYQVPGKPIRLLGLGGRHVALPDSAALAISDAELDERLTNEAGTSGGRGRQLRLMLSHYPTYIVPAADLGVDLVFSGHTHGGQIRLPPRTALTSGVDDMPAHLASGLLRHRNTLCLISRGVGTTKLPLRMFCPPQVPLCVLRRRSPAGRFTDAVELVWGW